MNAKHVVVFAVLLALTLGAFVASLEYGVMAAWFTIPGGLGWYLADRGDATLAPSAPPAARMAGMSDRPRRPSILPLAIATAIFVLGGYAWLIYHPKRAHAPLPLLASIVLTFGVIVYYFAWSPPDRPSQDSP